jgi:hypothetical protein
LSSSPSSSPQAATLKATNAKAEMMRFMAQ